MKLLQIIQYATRRLSLLSPFFAMAVPGAVQAQQQEVPLGFSWGPGETVERDSNLQRNSGLPGFPVLPDTLSSTNLMGAFHEIYSRQEITASATIGRVLFRNERQFDYTQEDIRGTLQSSLPYSINSTVSFERSAQLAHFADIGIPVRDVIDFNNLNATIDLPLAVDWRLVLGGVGYDIKNSATIEQPGDVSSAEFNGGIRYEPSSGNHIDLLLRDVRATYPNANASILINPGYRDRGADLRLDWIFSGLSHLTGDAGYVKRNYVPLLGSSSTELLALDPLISLNRNFAGPAYDLTYAWQVTTTSRFTFFGQRVSGAAGDNNYLSAVTEDFRLSPNYQSSAFFEWDAYWEWQRRNYFSNVYQIVYGLPPDVTRLDTTRSVGASVIWSPRRWLKATLAVHREHRDSTIPVWTYNDNTAILSIQAMLY